MPRIHRLAMPPQTVGGAPVWRAALVGNAAARHGHRRANELSPGVVTLIVESEPGNSTELFRYEYLKTQDPNERCDKMVEILQGSYFQEPARFSDLMTALFRTALDARRTARGRGTTLHSGVRTVQLRVTAFRAASRGSPTRTVPSGDLLAQPDVQSQSFRRVSRFSRSGRIGAMRRAIEATPLTTTPHPDQNLR